MRKMLVALPMTLAAAAVLSTTPIPVLSTVSEAKEISLDKQQGCQTNVRVCALTGCQGRNATTGRPIKGVEGFTGKLLDECMADCGKKHDACLKTGTWPSKIIGRPGGTDVKTKPGGVATVPKTPGKNSSGTLPNGPGGGVTQPKWSPNSPPIGTYHPRPPFSTTGPVGTYQSGGSQQGGPILLRSGGRR